LFVQSGERQAETECLEDFRGQALKLQGGDVWEWPNHKRLKLPKAAKDKGFVFCE
jgi:hypothetical protein